VWGDRGRRPPAASRPRRLPRSCRRSWRGSRGAARSRRACPWSVSCLRHRVGPPAGRDHTQATPTGPSPERGRRARRAADGMRRPSHPPRALEAALASPRTVRTGAPGVPRRWRTGRGSSTDQRHQWLGHCPNACVAALIEADVQARFTDRRSETRRVGRRVATAVTCWTRGWTPARRSNQVAASSARGRADAVAFGAVGRHSTARRMRRPARPVDVKLIELPRDGMLTAARYDALSVLARSSPRSEMRAVTAARIEPVRVTPMVVAPAAAFRVAACVGLGGNDLVAEPGGPDGAVLSRARVRGSPPASCAWPTMGSARAGAWCHVACHRWPQSGRG
jgi:hypothetical protein